MIWALADPHLSFGVPSKPMDVFGPAWENHAARLAEAWSARVGAEDWVLLPGDLSWGMNLQEAAPDLAYLDALPGQKLLSRGNHDYWWTSLKKLETFAEEQGWNSLHFMRMGARRIEGQERSVVVCGTRGWMLPGEREFSASDRKIYERELLRLQMALEEMEQIRKPGDAVICTLHYPPLLRQRMQTECTKLLERFGVPVCLYGHLHGRGAKEAFEGELRGVQYWNVAADHLNMTPIAAPLIEKKFSPEHAMRNSSSK